MKYRHDERFQGKSQGSLPFPPSSSASFLGAPSLQRWALIQREQWSWKNQYFQELERLWTQHLKGFLESQGHREFSEEELYLSQLSSAGSKVCSVVDDNIKNSFSMEDLKSCQSFFQNQGQRLRDLEAQYRLNTLHLLHRQQGEWIAIASLENMLREASGRSAFGPNSASSNCFQVHFQYGEMFAHSQDFNHQIFQSFWDSMEIPEESRISLAVL